MKALIIEDNAAQAEFTRKGMARLGFECRVAADGQTGLDALFADDYDIALVDIRLPVIGGLEVIAAARERGSRTPMIVLSVIGSPRSKAAGLDAGADDYLTKPFSFTELRARIDAVLRRSAPPDPAESVPLKVDTLAIDAALNQARRGTRTILLTLQETQLLVHLIRHRDETVTRRDILRDAWGYVSADDHLVECAVSRLRSKINAPGETPLIRTVRHLGYTII